MSTLSPSVSDQVAVGTEKILESGHVSEGPGRIASAPIPSVFSDDRGSIHRLRIGHRRINLLYSKKETMRSGYLNSVLSHDFVITGRVEVWTLAETGTVKKIYKEREYFSIEPYVPHILYFLEETNIAEWYDGTFRCWYYHPYRNIVNVQNSLLEEKDRSTPRHRLLVLKDEEDQGTVTSGPGDDSHFFARGAAVFWYTTAAFLIGWFMGAATVVTHPPRRT